jgi:hypothetical protein
MRDVACIGCKGDTTMNEEQKRALEHHIGNLADMAWWIKGYIAGAKESFNDCPFSTDHLNTLQKVIHEYRETQHRQEEVKP